MIQQRSAGVIVFREDLFGAREYLLLDYGRHWDFPKGHVERNEGDRAAALREVREETGIGLEQLVEGFAREITYVFRQKRELIRKTVIFFLGQTQNDSVTLSQEHSGYEWLAFDAAVKKLTYASARDLLTKAEEFLDRTCS